VVVGEAEANVGKQPVRVGRHLFMASELLDYSMKSVKVSRIDVSPAVSQVVIGTRLCVSSLSITAYDSEARILERAPLSISVRQDQKQKLALKRDKNDICVSPNEAGEYPMRFASLLPARDGTTRGAQIFLRVAEATSETTGAAGKGAESASTRKARPDDSFKPVHARQFINYR
jgi:hypothetical protein